jgi:hypothetical protein
MLLPFTYRHSADAFGVNQYKCKIDVYLNYNSKKNAIPRYVCVGLTSN